MRNVIVGCLFLLVLTGCDRRDENGSLKKENAGLKERIEELENEINRMRAAVPELKTRADYQKALEDIQNIGGAIEFFINEHQCPPRTTSIEELAGYKVGTINFIPFYLKVLPGKDPWGSEYLYRVEGRSYWIASSGSDGTFLGYEQQGGYDTLEGQDIVFSDGRFLYRPNG